MNGKADSISARIFWVALALYLFVLPIANTIAVRNLAFIVLIAVTAAVLVKARTMPVLPFARYWLAYFLVALVSVVFAVDPRMSLSELRVEVVYCILIFIVGVTWGALRRLRVVRRPPGSDQPGPYLGVVQRRQRGHAVQRHGQTSSRALRRSQR
ncbi:MAG: hypothetical protein IPK39_02345 [Sulfuritalea sp.]|nr:hypothetical protein [Sulfuritalea sp.]